MSGIEAIQHNDDKRLTILYGKASYTFNLEGEKAKLQFLVTSPSASGSLTTLTKGNDLWIIRLDTSQITKESNIISLNMFMVSGDTDK